MKIACIGDLHGVSRWREALDLEVDHYVFVGDYVDSQDLSDEVIYRNLVDVVEFKKFRPQQVTLLLGNHDIQYLLYPEILTTGFRPSMAELLKGYFLTNRFYFQVACSFADYVFTHAGLCNSWVEGALGKWRDLPDLTEKLNDMVVGDISNEIVAIGKARGGPEACGGPLWCDYYEELVEDPLTEVNQVVGHTRGTTLTEVEIQNCKLYNVNYLAYSDEPIFVLET